MDETALLERSRRIGTSTWSDALDQCGINGVVRGLTQRGGHGRFAGFAVTALEVSGPLGAYPRADFAVGRLIAALEPGRVLVVDAGGAEISTFGGLAALATAKRGAAAVIIDGACRDVDEIRAAGLWVASRHVTPQTGKTRIRVEAIGRKVTVGGVTVELGDLVIGDETGIVVVPRAALDQVLVNAEAALSKDLEIETALKSGRSFAEAAAAADYI